MKLQSKGLSDFSANKYSQFGEDGIIEEIFRRIGPSNKICVEFGAWDGFHLSNTCLLWKEQNWTSYLIEGDINKYELLRSKTAKYPKVNAIHRFICPEGSNRIDNILTENGVDASFELLSIDVDGDDLHIFHSLNQFIPKVVVIEFNPTIPPYMEFTQEKGDCIGSSAKSILKVAQAKGYKLAANTDANLILVHSDYFEQLEIKEVNLKLAFNTKYLRNIVESFEGENFLSHDNLTYSNVKKKKGKAAMLFKHKDNGGVNLPVRLLSEKKNDKSD